jgi:hypothetical protein
VVLKVIVAAGAVNNELAIYRRGGDDHGRSPLLPSAFYLKSAARTSRI